MSPIRGADEVTPTLKRKGSAKKASSTTRKKSKVVQHEEASEEGFRATHLPDTKSSWLDVGFLAKLGNGIGKASQKDLIVLNVYAVNPRAARTMGGDLLRVNPLAEFVCSVYGIPAGAALVRLRSLASSHRRYLIDVSAMDSKPLKAIPGDLVKLGRGIGVQFERFTQPLQKIDVSIEANPWLKERDVKDVLEGLNFVDNVGGVKYLRLKNGNPAACFNACI